MMRLVRPVLILSTLAFLSACAVNPATGEQQFTALLPASQEAVLGAQEHEKVLEQFGGPYQNQKLQGYVDRIGQRVAKAGERPDVTYTFTVLDSSIVNAFALPGGYVYVTRGLLALANTEAEVAGVLGHEIGHVTARHTAERVSQATLAQLLVAGLGIAAGAGEGMLQGASVASDMVLKSFSRDQELQADQLGIRYIAETGYDPFGMVSFLDAMRAESELQAAQAGQEDGAEPFNYFSTHPRTADRVERAMTMVQETPKPPDAEVGRDNHLAAINGMVFGDSPRQGFVRGSVFAHPEMGFRFEVPEGFRLINGENEVTAVHSNGSAIAFDMASAEGARSPEQYLSQVWVQGIQDVERLDVNGLPGATAAAKGQTPQGAADVRMVAIQRDADTFYRFMFVTPPNQTNAMSEALRATTYSLRPITKQESASLKPMQIEIVTVRPGDTIQSLAAQMAVEDFAEQQFRVLNDLDPGVTLQPGQKVKVVR